MLLWLKLGALAFALASGFAGGWQVRSWKAGADDRDRAERAAMEVFVRSQRSNNAAGKYEAHRTAAAARERAIAPQVARVVADPAMAGTCLSADSLRILVDDVAQHGIASEPARAVSPAASAATR